MRRLTDFRLEDLERYAEVHLERKAQVAVATGDLLALVREVKHWRGLDVDLVTKQRSGQVGQ